MNERGEIAIGLMVVLTIALCGLLGDWKDIKHEKELQALKEKCAIVQLSD